MCSTPGYPVDARRRISSPLSQRLHITMNGAYLRFCAAAQKRKGIDSLARLCQEKLQADPFSGCLFVFRSRRGTSIRILVYDSCEAPRYVELTLATRFPIVVLSSSHST